MPNTKTKKFDWQIFLAVFCILLVICCATICCVIGNTEKGVADAYTDEEVGVSNIEFTVDEGFYIKNFYQSNGEQLERFVNYYFYFISSLSDFNTDFAYNNVCGSMHVNYNNSIGVTMNADIPLYLLLSKSADSEFITFSVFFSAESDFYILDFSYDFVNKTLDEFILYLYNTQSTDSPYNYYVSFADSPDTPNTFSNQLAVALIGDADEISAFNFLEFSFYNTSNIGCIFSPNQNFANPPVVMPSGVYYDNINDLRNQIEDWKYTANNYYQQVTELQNQINQNNALIEQLRDEIRYYESLDLNLSTIDVFNPARMKSSTFVYDGVTYTSNSIVSTDDGWDVYSSTYHNEELPPNYGVGFSLFLPEYITNTKFYVYGDITGWYNYTYCSEPDEQGNQQCYQVSDMVATISVGYRNQNGNIVNVGTFTSNLPGTGGVDFFVDTPTNEIVFFVENCNLMRVGRSVQVSYYQYDTQSIYNEGYENGKSQGIKIGREEGYYQGVADANDYSFFSLFTSVFDAPITAIVGKWGDSDGDGVYEREGGMLNFYIPGLDINFAPFLLSLFTIAIIILVIRFVMARKS